MVYHHYQCMKTVGLVKVCGDQRDEHHKGQMSSS